MRTTLLVRGLASLAFVCGLTSPKGHAQGAVILKNFGSGSNGTIDPIAYVTLWDPFGGGEKLSGTGYTAQLYFGPQGSPEGSLQPVPGSQTGFLSDNAAGLFGSPTVIIPGVAIGSQAVLQVRVWDNLAGTVMSYEQALVVLASPGQSSLIQVTLGNPNALEPGRIPTLVGLQPFQVGVLIPEPSTSTLGLLGGCLILMRRQRIRVGGSSSARRLAE